MSEKATRRGAENFLIKAAPKEDLLAAIERASARNTREHKHREEHLERLIT